MHPLENRCPLWRKERKSRQTTADRRRGQSPGPNPIPRGPRGGGLLETETAPKGLNPNPARARTDQAGRPDCMGVEEGKPDIQVSIDAPRSEGVAPDKSTEHSGQEFPGWTEELSGFAEYIDYITDGADSDAGNKGSQDGVEAEGTNRLIPTPVPEEKDPAVECPDTEENEVVICQLRSSSMLKVAVSLNNVPLQAVVDTAAEATIISDRVLQMLKPAPQKIRDVVLSTAGRDMKIKGVVVGPVHIKLGENVFTENIYTAPISDDMLLGLDFLCRHSTAINIGEKQLEVVLQKIPLSLGHTRNPDKVAQVYTQERTTILPML